MVLIAPSHGQEVARTKAVPFEGTQAFCHVLDRFNLAPVPDLASFKQLDPAETVLVVFGDNRILDEIALDDFKQRGGAVLIASDRDDEGRLVAWKLAIDGQPVSEPRSSAYKRISSCPLVRRLDRRHPLFRGMSAESGLATNSPGFLRVPRRAMPILAVFSGNCKVPSGDDVGGAPFLVAALAGDRVIVMAGHSVFMNGMIAQPDNDNWTFSWNCVRWLSEGPNGPRKHAFFLDEGKVRQSFDVPLTMPIPRFPTVQLLNGLLRGLEDEGFFNRVLQSVVSRRQIWRSAMVMVTVILLVWAWRRLGKARFRQDAGVPRTALEPVGDFAVSPPPMLERQRALVQSGNYWESGQALARFFFEEVGRLTGGPAPSVVLAGGGWWRRRAATRQVRDLWTLAYGPTGHLSSRALARLPTRLDQLASEIRDGRMLLQSPAIN
ncbi:MAG: hypothetical protein FJ271_11100 [Planctomycetes bacterium]|nr:hypothetical protein [Planctomycetota bacterium]